MQCDIGVDHPGIAQFFEFRVRQFRRASADHDVDELRPGQAARNVGDLICRGRRFDKSDVGPGFAVGGGALEGGGEAFRRDGIGACDDQKVVVVPRVDGRLDLSNHLLGRDHLLARKMAAALGKHLILDLQRIGAGAFE